MAVQRSLNDEQWNTVIEGSSRCAVGEPMTVAGMLEAELQASQLLQKLLGKLSASGPVAGLTTGSYKQHFKRGCPSEQPHWPFRCTWCSLNQLLWFVQAGVLCCLAAAFQAIKPLIHSLAETSGAERGLLQSPSKRIAEGIELAPGHAQAELVARSALKLAWLLTCRSSLALAWQHANSRVQKQLLTSAAQVTACVCAGVSCCL